MLSNINTVVVINNAIAQVHLGILRNRNTKGKTFRSNAKSAAHFLIHEAGNYLSSETERITTSMGVELQVPVIKTTNIGACYIWRSGAVFQPIIDSSLPFTDITHYFLGYQRDEETKEASCYYSNMNGVAKTDVLLLCDPMLATAGTAINAINDLKAEGVKEENIIFICFIAAEFGINKMVESFPNLRKIITLAVDPDLNDKKYILPGLGDFGQNFYGVH